eukprot:723650-Amphidinium_carterae.1
MGGDLRTDSNYPRHISDGSLKSRRDTRHVMVRLHENKVGLPRAKLQTSQTYSSYYCDIEPRVCVLLHGFKDQASNKTRSVGEEAQKKFKCCVVLQQDCGISRA